MKALTVEEELAKVAPSQRVLLLSHCQRPSQTCPGKFEKAGLRCPEDCREVCNLALLRSAAIEEGYLGICIAAGGAQALKFVKEKRPGGVVAIACHKELDEGVAAVGTLVGVNYRAMPPVVTVPLLRDGCVDTEVDMEQALAAIRFGCAPRKP